MPARDLARCESFRQVARQQWLRSRLSLEKLAKRLGLCKSHLSEILSGSGRKHLDPALYRPFCYATGSWAIYQWLDMDRRGQTGKTARIAALRAELNELEAA